METECTLPRCVAKGVAIIMGIFKYFFITQMLFSYIHLMKKFVVDGRNVLQIFKCYNIKILMDYGTK